MLGRYYAARMAINNEAYFQEGIDASEHANCFFELLEWIERDVRGQDDVLYPFFDKAMKMNPLIKMRLLE